MFKATVMCVVLLGLLALVVGVQAQTAPVVVSLGSVQDSYANALEGNWGAFSFVDLYIPNTAPTVPIGAEVQGIRVTLSADERAPLSFFLTSWRPSGSSYNLVGSYQITRDSDLRGQTVTFEVPSQYRWEFLSGDVLGTSSLMGTGESSFHCIPWTDDASAPSTLHSLQSFATPLPSTISSFTWTAQRRMPVEFLISQPRFGMGALAAPYAIALEGNHGAFAFVNKYDIVPQVDPVLAYVQGIKVTLSTAVDSPLSFFLTTWRQSGSTSTLVGSYQFTFAAADRGTTKYFEVPEASRWLFVTGDSWGTSSPLGSGASSNHVIPWTDDANSPVSESSFMWQTNPLPATVSAWTYTGLKRRFPVEFILVPTCAPGWFGGPQVHVRSGFTLKCYASSANWYAVPNPDGRTTPLPCPDGKSSPEMSTDISACV